jgi:hypothetical protein
MALGSTQPLREMSARNLPAGKGRPVRNNNNNNNNNNNVVHYEVIIPHIYTVQSKYSISLSKQSLYTITLLRSA